MRGARLCPQSAYWWSPTRTSTRNGTGRTQTPFPGPASILELVCQNLRADPSYRFGQDQVTVWAPVLYRLEQKDRDELLSAVSDGRLEPLGGMWTASELAEPGGESLLRQLQYGQRWMTSALGRTAGTAWFIDQFGQIPQLPHIPERHRLHGLCFRAGTSPRTARPWTSRPTFWCSLRTVAHPGALDARSLWPDRL